MKKLILVLAMVASPAFAGEVSTDVVNSSGAAALSANNQNIIFNSPGETTARIKSNPDVSSPSLTTTLTGTCMGSTSGGISANFIGASLGSTWTDKDCDRRFDSKRLQDLGLKEAAFNLMCMKKEVYISSKNTEYECPKNKLFEQAYNDFYGIQTEDNRFKGLGDGS